MNHRAAVVSMKRAIAEYFPKEAEEVDAQMLDFDDDAYEVWLERFCDVTSDAMKRRDAVQVDAYLSFVSQQLTDADEDMRSALNVAYAENLMSNLDVDAKRWAWPRVPANLKRLYLEMWGEPRI